MAEDDEFLSAAESPTRARVGRYEHVVRIAVLLAGDHELAQSCVDDALATIPRGRRDERLARPASGELWQAVVGRVARAEERLGAGAADAPITVVRHNGPSTPTPRELRWAVLSLPVLVRAAVVLPAFGVTGEAITDTLGLSVGEADRMATQGHQAVGVRLGVEPTDLALDDQLVGAARTLAYEADPEHVGDVLTGRRTFVDRRPRDAAAVGAAAVVLASGLAWLAVRSPARPAVLSAPAAVAATTTTPTRPTAPAPATTTPTTATSVASPTTAAATTAPTAAPPIETTATTEAEPPADEETIPPARPASTPRTPIGTTPPTVAPAAPASPATTPATAAAPTAAPTTTVAPVVAGLRVTTATCTVASGKLSLRLDGQAASTASEIVIVTPWGRFEALGRGNSGTPNRWVLAVSVPVTAPATGPHSLTITAGGDKVDVSVTC